MDGQRFVGGDLVTLRTIEENDLAFLQRNVNDPRIRRTTDVFTPVNGMQQREHFEQAISGGDVHLLVWADGTRVGYVNLTQIDPEAGSGDLGLWITPDQQRNGYGRAAVELLVTDTFGNRRIHRVEARCYASNTGVVRLLENVGFELEGQLREAAYVGGERCDVLVFGVLESEWDGTARP